MSRKAQVSIEFIAIVGISMFILTVSTLFVMDYLRSNQSAADIQRVTQLGYRIVDEAANVYVFGEGAFVNIDASVPDSVKNVFVVDNNTLVFELVINNGVTEVPIFSDVTINGTRADGVKVYVNSDPDLKVGGGKATFRVTSKGDWVEVSYIQ